MAKIKRQKLVSPVAPAMWPKLNRPDTKFKKEGEYSVQLRFDPKNNEDHKAFLASVKEAEDAAHAKARRDEGDDDLKLAPSVIKPVKEKDESTGKKVATGLYDVKFGMKATVTPRNGEPFTQRPTLFDSKRNILPPDKVQVGHGSELKIAAVVNPWYTAALGAGVSLWLDGVMVMKLVEPGNKSADELFGAADDIDDDTDGFTYTETAVASTAFNEGADDSPEDEEDF